MKTKKAVLIIISLVLVLIMALNFAGCGKEIVITEEVPEGEMRSQLMASELTAGLTANEVSGKSADSKFTKSQFEFCAELFKACVKERGNESVFISPLSVQLVLAMTGNGANGETKAQIEKGLSSTIPLDELNGYLYSYVNSLASEKDYKTNIANSLWLRDNENCLQAENEFLQKCCDYYSAEVYKASFDSQTVKDMNLWVSKKTDGMIKNITNEINPEDMMFILNAVMFDAVWDEPYVDGAASNGTFTSVTGEQRRVMMMPSGEDVYLEDDSATGFIKDYKDGKYAFAALLPNENVNINDYVESLTGEKISAILRGAQNERVTVKIPKFTCEFNISLKDVLSEMGMNLAFDEKEADFSKMAKSSMGNIFIGDAFHKAFITVDERGTKAAAATIIKGGASAAPTKIREVFLERPFVYMIIDKSQNLPIFFGVLTDIQQ